MRSHPSDRGRMRPVTLLSWLLGLAVAAHASRADGPKADPAKPRSLSAERKAKNVESFEVVWTTVRDRHFDPKLNGVDWGAVRDELRPKVEQAETMEAARAAMSEALNRLKQTHFGIIPGDAYDEAAAPQSDGRGETGVDVRVVEGRATVTAVRPESAAATLGLKPGWVVDKIRGKPTAEVLEAVEKAYSKSGLVGARKSLAIVARLRGKVGETVAVDFLDAEDKPVHLDLPLVEPRGTIAKFGNLPPFHVHLTSKRVEETVGYVALNIFFDPINVMTKFAEAIQAHREADGLILDLRGNPGGIGAMSMGLGGWLISARDQKLGTMTTRDGSMMFVLNPRPLPFTGPVAILVDELSMSTSEILAGGLKDLNRARVFGTKTPGAALPSRIDILPNGDRFQYAFANYISTGGKPLEGLGVVPDTEVPLTRAALLGGHDPALDAAVAWVRSRKKAKP